jgi:hypothetical protein
MTGHDAEIGGHDDLKYAPKGQSAVAILARLW